MAVSLFKLTSGMPLREEVILRRSSKSSRMSSTDDGYRTVAGGTTLLLELYYTHRQATPFVPTKEQRRRIRQVERAEVEMQRRVSMERYRRETGLPGDDGGGIAGMTTPIEVDREVRRSVTGELSALF